MRCSVQAGRPRSRGSVIRSILARRGYEPLDLTGGGPPALTEFLNRFTEERWEEVLEEFDYSMRTRHGPDRLGSGWAHLIGMFGRFEKMGEVSPVSVGDTVVADVPVYFEAGEAMVWIRLDREGKVSGLRLHPPSR